MPKSRTKRKPAYTLHKPTGQARVRIAQKDHYLGPFGSPESRQRYDDLVSEWFATQDVRRCTLTVDDIVLLFMEHARKFYLHPDGTPTSEIHCLRLAMRPLIKRSGEMLVREFGPLALKAVRQDMVTAKLTRKSINAAIHRIRRMFGWAVENELCEPGVHAALKCVASLKAGRSEAVESDRVLPVAQDVVDATLPHLPTPLAAMIRLQLLCGCRPGEICQLRPGDIDFSREPWCFTPQQHKTTHHGHDRRIYFGPLAQEILRPFLNRPADAWCFSPAEAQAERQAAKRAGRKSPMTPSQAARRPLSTPKRRPGTRYNKDSFARAVSRAAKAAGVSNWSPNQLRHAAATRLRAEFGIEASRLVLGHRDAGVTQVYAERDFEGASKIMQRVG